MKLILKKGWFGRLLAHANIKIGKRKRGRVFRILKRLDDGSFLIAGFVNRQRSVYHGQ